MYRESKLSMCLRRTNVIVVTECLISSLEKNKKKCHISAERLTVEKIKGQIRRKGTFHTNFPLPNHKSLSNRDGASLYIFPKQQPHSHRYYKLSSSWAVLSDNLRDLVRFLPFPTALSTSSGKPSLSGAPRRPVSVDAGAPDGAPPSKDGIARRASLALGRSMLLST